MTATVPAAADSGQGAPQWPAWAPPAAAGDQWVALQEELEALGWRVACQADPEAWWSTEKSAATTELRAAAVEACSWCPVAGLCRDYAVAAGEREGVWGGTTPADRRRLRGAL